MRDECRRTSTRQKRARPNADFRGLSVWPYAEFVMLRCGCSPNGSRRPPTSFWARRRSWRHVFANSQEITPFPDPASTRCQCVAQRGGIVDRKRAGSPRGRRRRRRRRLPRPGPSPGGPGAGRQHRRGRARCGVGHGGGQGGDAQRGAVGAGHHDLGAAQPEVERIQRADVADGVGPHPRLRTAAKSVSACSRQRSAPVRAARRRHGV